MAALDPMPVEGPLGFFGGLPYLFTVTLARMKRSGVISSFHREIADEQMKLDEMLRDLGKQAREVELAHPMLDQEMGNLHALENQRVEAEAGSADVAEKLKQAEASFGGVENDCNQRINAAQEEINTAQAALTEKNNQLRSVKARIAQHDKELKGLSAALRSKTAQAAKAQDETKQQAMEQEAVDLSGKIADAEQQKAAAEAEASELEGPVAELTAKLTDGKTRLQEAQRELAAGRQELAKTRQSLGAEERQKGLELTRLDQEIAQKFLDIGRLLESNRVDNPAFEELFGRIDETAGEIRRREEKITKLQAERDTFDHRARKNGIILVASIAGTVLVLIIFLIVLFTVILD
jgi:chromosome segregation ATPase